MESVFRPWGHFSVVYECSGCKIKKLTVFSGERTSLQSHKHRSEHLYILGGDAEITVAERLLKLKSGESCDIAAETVHRISNAGATLLEIIEVQQGEILNEEDILRLEDDYGRV